MQHDRALRDAARLEGLRNEGTAGVLAGSFSLPGTAGVLAGSFRRPEVRRNPTHLSSLTLRLAALLLVLAASTAAAEETVTLGAAADTYVSSGNTGANFGIWTTATFGRDAPSKSGSMIIYRAFLHFDLSSLPDNALLLEAKLRLFLDWTVNPGSNFVTANALATGFVEGDGTTGVT